MMNTLVDYSNFYMKLNMKHMWSYGNYIHKHVKHILSYKTNYSNMDILVSSLALINFC